MSNPPRFNPQADAELARIYGEAGDVASKIKILDDILGGPSNYSGFGGNGIVTEDQKLGCLEYEYLGNLGLIDVSNVARPVAPDTIALQIKNEDEISLPSWIAATSLTLSEIGAIACLACAQTEGAHPELTSDRLSHPDMSDAIIALKEKGVFKVEATGPNKIKLIFNLNVIAPK